MNQEYHLNLSKQNLQSIPDEIFAKKDLKELILNQNHISTIPVSIAGLVNLEVLSLTANELTDLPEELFQLPKLRVLRLGRNRIVHLPQNIAEANRLGLLFLEYNELSELPESFARMESLTSLQLHHNEFSEIPEVLFELPSLKKLEISVQGDNVSLPSDLKNWRYLTHLKLTDSKLRHLPSNFIDLRGLSVLNLSKNEFAVFPEEILELRQLQKLYLGHNRLTSIPDSLPLLRQLTHLNLSYNKLHSLPENIYKLSKLQQLLLSNNVLQALPKRMAEMRSLSILNAGQNQISTLIETDLSGPELKKLTLVNNPLDVLPETVECFVKSQWDAEAMRECLKIEKLKGKEVVNHVRIILLGDETSGRSSWVRRMIEEDLELGERLDIVFTRFMRYEEQQMFETLVSIWEPGYRELQHPTHHLLWSPDAIYLLFLDASKESSEKEASRQRWLQRLIDMEVASSVVVVHSKVDQKRSEMPSDSFGDLPFELLEHEISHLEEHADNFEDLKLRLEERIWRNFQVERKVAKAYQMVQEQIARLRSEKRYLSEREFIEICENCKVNAADIPELRDFLHDTGVVLNYPHGSHGQSHIFPDIHWLMEAIHGLFDIVEEQLGQFHEDDLPQIWSDPSVFSHRYEILDLICGLPFKFCYRLADRQFLVPHLLPENHVDPNIPHDAYTWEYHYDRLPYHLIFRLMAIEYLQALSIEYWRNGMLVSMEQARGWIFQSNRSNANIIQVSISGTKQERRALKAIIRKSFSAVHGGIAPQMKAQELVVCPNCSERNGDSYFAVETLIRRQEAGKTYAECDVCFHETKLEHLLYGQIPKTFDEMRKMVESNLIVDALNELKLFIKLHCTVSRQDFETQISLLKSDYLENLNGRNDPIIRTRVKNAILSMIVEIEEENC